VILSPVSSAIEVRTVIGRAPAAFPVFWMALGTANAPKTALDAGAPVKHAGKEMASVREAVGLSGRHPVRPRVSGAGAGTERTADGTDGQAEEAAGDAQ
jgi:hypothetical protein